LQEGHNLGRDHQNKANESFNLIQIGGLELFVFGDLIQPDRPWVFVSHGIAECVYDCIDYARSLVARGLLVIGIEHRNHGRRFLSDTNLDIYAECGPTEIIGIVHGTAQDISMAIDLLEVHFGFCPRAIGVTGHSLAGRTALTAFLLDARIDVCASLIATGDFRQLLQCKYRQKGLDEREITSRLNEGFLRLIDKFDPVSNLSNLNDRPLLLTTGEVDRVVPSACIELFYKKVKAVYSGGHRLELKKYPGVAHKVTSEMRAYAADWLEKWLLNG
jgi:dienelactone hydrolase